MELNETEIKLMKFCEEFNADKTRVNFDVPVTNYLAEQFASEAFKKSFTYTETYFRMSNAGQHLLYLADQKLASGNVPEFSRRYWFFFRGNMAELYLMSLIMSAGFSIDNYQEPLEFQGIKGSCDFVVDGDTLVDTKCVSSKAFHSDYVPPDYSTQMLLYLTGFHNTGKTLKRSGWLYLDAATGGIKYKPYRVNLVEAEQTLKQCLVKQQAYDDIKCLDDLYRIVIPAMPAKKVTRGVLHYELPKEVQYLERSERYYPRDSAGHVDIPAFFKLWSQYGHDLEQYFY